MPSHITRNRTDGLYPDHECPIYMACSDGTVHQGSDEFFYRKDGSAIPISYSSRPIVDRGRIRGAVICFQDITERKRAEDALRTSEALQRAIAENYPNSYVSIIEKDLTIGFALGQEFKKQHLDARQFIGLNLEQVFADQASNVQTHYLKTFAGEEQSFELVSNAQYQQHRSVPLYAPDGSIPRILSVVENITQRKQLENVNLARLRLLQFAVNHTLEELIEETLNETELLTGSVISFYHFLDADQKTLWLQNWSTRTKRDLCRAKGCKGAWMWPPKGEPLLPSDGRFLMEKEKMHEQRQIPYCRGRVRGGGKSQDRACVDGL